MCRMNHKACLRRCGLLLLAALLLAALPSSWAAPVSILDNTNDAAASNSVWTDGFAFKPSWSLATIFQVNQHTSLVLTEITVYLRRVGSPPANPIIIELFSVNGDGEPDTMLETITPAIDPLATLGTYVGPFNLIDGSQTALQPDTQYAIVVRASRSVVVPAGLTNYVRIGRQSPSAEYVTNGVQYVKTVGNVNGDWSIDLDEQYSILLRGELTVLSPRPSPKPSPSPFPEEFPKDRDFTLRADGVRMIEVRRETHNGVSRLFLKYIRRTLVNGAPGPTARDKAVVFRMLPDGTLRVVKFRLEGEDLSNIYCVHTLGAATNNSHIILSSDCRQNWQNVFHKGWPHYWELLPQGLCWAPRPGFNNDGQRALLTDNAYAIATTDTNELDICGGGLSRLRAEFTDCTCEYTTFGK